MPLVPNAFGDEWDGGEFEAEAFKPRGANEQFGFMVVYWRGQGSRSRPAHWPMRLRSCEKN